MDCTTIKIDGQDVLNDGAHGILYSRKEWRKLAYGDERINNDGMHGSLVSPTYARYRIITLEGYVDRLGNDLEQEAVEYLQRLFALQSVGGEISPKTLYIMDTFGNEWTLQVKVGEPIDFDVVDENFKTYAWKWRVTLESIDTPIYKSLAELLVSNVEGQYGGVELETTLGIAFDDYYNIIECTTTGNLSAPARFVITATNTINTPLTIRNITDGTSFVMNISAVAGDVIIVDSDTFSITKNGVNNNATRLPGSVRPKVTATTQFGVDDIDGALLSQDFTVDVYFKNSLL